MFKREKAVKMTKKKRKNSKLKHFKNEKVEVRRKYNNKSLKHLKIKDHSY